MPIYMADLHSELTIKRVTGDDKMKLHLNSLGFIEGETITVINKINKNVIVKIKGISLAITHELAKQIYV